MTERLYYHDAYLTAFEARIVERADEGRRVYLDRTAFYPDSGGQPHDRGTLNGVEVTGVEDEDGRIAHILAAPAAGDTVHGCVDWARRYDHMQQHSGQHLLSAVLIELFGIHTVGFHMSAESSTIDVVADRLEPERIRAAEERCAELVFANRPITITFEEASRAAPTLRAHTGREGILRIANIEGCDRNACGGTHVRSTGEIGPVAVRKTEKVHGNLRLEFLCGMRAVRRARKDFETLSSAAGHFSAALDETPALVEALLARVREAGKANRALSAELASLRGRDLYARTAPDASGLRRAWMAQAAGALGDDMRAMASAFIGQPRAVFAAASNDPPSLLVAASADSGFHAGDLLKAAVSAVGGRGGGSATMAQGSVPAGAALERVIEDLRAAGVLAGGAAL